MSLKLEKYSDQNNNNVSDNLEAKKKILQGLNKEQQDAVSIIDGPVLIVAGAGSGKTKVLTHRIAHLLLSNINPWNILALTFTNKAAGELKERINHIVGANEANKIWSGTFHSIFAKILRIEANVLGYDSSFSIYDTDDSLSAVKNIMNGLGISQQMYPPNQIRSAISSAKNKMQSWEKMRTEANSSFLKQASQVYEMYESYLYKNNAMDFDDLLLKMILLFKRSPETLEKYQDKFRYILVDEYQDTNRAQYLIVQMLAKKLKNICVVGDDAQSIYRWRGADINNILDFKNDYPSSKVVRLEQNYRSTQTILDAAGSVIKHNSNQIPKKLWTANPGGDKIDLIACEDDRDEAMKIVTGIKQKINAGFRPKDFAILYRTNAQSAVLEQMLRSAKLPYIIIGGLSFFKRKEVKDTISYLKLLVNHRDSESLLRVINEPPRGLGKTSIDHLQTWSQDKGISLYEAFLQSEMNSHLQARAIVASKKFTSLIEKYSQLRNELNLKDLVISYIEETGILDMYKEIDTEESEDRWNNIQQLLSDVSSNFRSNPEMTLEEYLSQVTLISDFDEKDTSLDNITVMTMHSAKGLEFPLVYISGMENGLFPLAKAENDIEEEAEERRLFYVGITRAKEKLYLTYAQKRMRFGELSYQVPSKFLKEIDKDLLNLTGALKSQFTTDKSGYQTRMNQFSTSSSSNKLFDDRKSEIQKSSYDQTNNFNDNYSQIQSNSNKVSITSFKYGDKVSHSKFGPGTIVGLKGEGDNRQATVRFDSIGKKSLMLKFANLIKIK